MEQSPFKILIIEDEPAIAESLVLMCDFKGYESTLCADGTQGLKEALSFRYDLILLDLMLPNMDGLSICQEVRKKNVPTPIIILTAKTSEDDIIQGLQMGADDYVSKPFSVGQLLARMEVALRRSQKTLEDQNFLKIGQLEINRNSQVGRYRGKEIEFTQKEVDILEYLWRFEYRTVSRQELLREVWGYEQTEQVDTRTIDTHITKIRKKIENDPSKPMYLVTLRGEGYRLFMP